MESSFFSDDITEFIQLLAEYEVKYMIVGGGAVIYYGHSRLTGDIDIFYGAETGNTQKLYNALEKFWRGSIPGVTSPNDFIVPGNIIQFGVVPNRIDLLNRIDAVDFNTAWDKKVKDSIEIHNKSFPIYFISIDLLIQNKETVRRYKDLDDLRYLKKVKYPNL
jgi:hypothetical protein